jgi:moderate conductance mechanosensitive channel
MDPLDPLRRVARDIFNPELIAGAIEMVISLALIALGAWVALRISLIVIRRTAAWRTGHPAARMTPIAEGLLRYAIIFTALILMLAVLHVNVTPVLASATVLGLTIGFGAQQIIRDLLAGIFLLSEGIIQIGDTVRVDTSIRVETDIGIVERVTLRVTQFRKFSGELVTVANGSITRIGNMSRGYARAIVQTLVPYGASIGAAVEALREATQAWSTAHPADRRAEPQIDGVVELRDTGAVVQCSVLVPPGRRWAVESDLRQRVLEALVSRGIERGAVSPASPSAPSGAPPQRREDHGTEA